MAGAGENSVLGLFEAIRNGNVELVRDLLPSIQDINETDEQGNTALIIACDSENDEIVELLLNHDGVDVNARGSWNYTALHCLSLRGKLDSIRRLFERWDVDVHAETQSKETPLMRAAKNGHEEVIKFLQSKGADINHCNDKGFTILHYACITGCLKSVKFFVECGADVNVCNFERNETPLMKAASWGHLDVCQLLIDKGASVNAKTSYDKTPLIYAACWGRVNVARLLLDNGANVNAVGFEVVKSGRRTALSGACKANNSALVRLLLERGADVNYPGEYNLGLLICALYGSLECAEVLLEAGANTSWKYNDHTSASLASRHGHLRLAALLKRYEDTE